MLVVGDKEVAEGTVSVRTRAEGDQGARRVYEFVREAMDEAGPRAA